MEFDLIGRYFPFLGSVLIWILAAFLLTGVIILNAFRIASNLPPQSCKFRRKLREQVRAVQASIYSERWFYVYHQKRRRRGFLQRNVSGKAGTSPGFRAISR